MITSIGMRGRGVPWGRKWARDAVPAHRGMAIPRFMDSWVVGVNECGRRPSRLVDPINRISEISMSAHVCPLRLWIDNICFDVSWINHC